MPTLFRNSLVATLFIGSTVLSVSALAKSVGTVMVSKGKVWVVDEKGKKQKGRVGFKISAKDTIITEKDSRAKLIMLDKNVINVSPESQVSLEKYEFDPKNDKKDVLLNVIYGKVRSNVEQKYDGTKNKFQVKTKAAVAGVRGTDFLSGYNRSTQQSQFVTFQGMVEVGLPGRNGVILNPVSVAPGQFTTANVGGAPEPPKQMSRKALADFNSDSLAAPEDSDRSPSADDNQGHKEESGSDQGDQNQDKPEGSDKKEGSSQDGGPSTDNGNGEPRDEAKKDNGSGENKSGSNGNNGPGGETAAGGSGEEKGQKGDQQRSPASQSPTASSPMYSSNDLPSGGGPVLGPNLPTGPSGPQLPSIHRDVCALNPLAPGCGGPNLQGPICEQCRDLQQGKTRLIIDIISQ